MPTTPRQQPEKREGDYTAGIQTGCLLLSAALMWLVGTIMFHLEPGPTHESPRSTNTEPASTADGFSEQAGPHTSALSHACALSHSCTPRPGANIVTSVVVNTRPSKRANGWPCVLTGPAAQLWRSSTQYVPLEHAVGYLRRLGHYTPAYRVSTPPWNMLLGPYVAWVSMPKHIGSVCPLGTCCWVTYVVDMSLGTCCCSEHARITSSTISHSTPSCSECVCFGSL